MSHDSDRPRSGLPRSTGRQSFDLLGLPGLLAFLAGVAVVAIVGIVIDPLDDSLIQPSSVDVRISNLFRVFRNHTAGVIDVKRDLSELTELIEMPATSGETPPSGRPTGSPFSVSESAT